MLALGPDFAEALWLLDQGAPPDRDGHGAQLDLATKRRDTLASRARLPATREACLATSMSAESGQAQERALEIRSLLPPGSLAAPPAPPPRQTGRSSPRCVR